MGEDGEERGGAAVHDGRAQAADQPGADVGVALDGQEPGVLDHGEARADGEAGDGGVQFEADAVEREEQHDQGALEALLDGRRDVAAVAGKPDREAVHDAPVDQEAGPRDRAAQEDQDGDPAQADQVEQVEAVKGDQQHDHRSDRDDELQCQIPVHQAPVPARRG